MNRTPDEYQAGRIRRNIDMTLENIVNTNNCIAFAEDKKLKACLREKNDRRVLALEGMRRNLQSQSESKPHSS